MASTVTLPNPFLLPLCVDCGGSTRLAKVEPHPGQEESHDLHTFICLACGAQQTKVSVRRK
jgi:hypothetical protein